MGGFLLQEVELKSQLNLATGDQAIGTEHIHHLFKSLYRKNAEKEILNLH